MTRHHELHRFFESVSRELALEYGRIRRRVSEDPGTAGDETEEHWASILRSWLPADLQVVTKGRVLGHSGEASPQVDILVLDSGYPCHLVDKKLYLAGGVLACFECKLTLRKRHLKKCFETAKAIKQISQSKPPFLEELGAGKPTLATELIAPIICGVLAHSQDFGPNPPDEVKTFAEISVAIDDASAEVCEAPAEMVDMVCVADCISALLQKEVALENPHPKYHPDNGPTHQVSATYFAYRGVPVDGVWPGVLGSAVTYLLRLLARQRPSLRRLADYYDDTGIRSVGTGSPRIWPLEILSDHVLSRLRAGDGSLDPWSDWSLEL